MARYILVLGLLATAVLSPVVALQQQRSIPTLPPVVEFTPAPAISTGLDLPPVVDLNGLPVAPGINLAPVVDLNGLPIAPGVNLAPVVDLNGLPVVPGTNPPPPGINPPPIVPVGVFPPTAPTFAPGINPPPIGPIGISPPAIPAIPVPTVSPPADVGINVPPIVPAEVNPVPVPSVPIPTVAQPASGGVSPPPPQANSYQDTTRWHANPPAPTTNQVAYPPPAPGNPLQPVSTNVVYQYAVPAGSPPPAGVMTPTGMVFQPPPAGLPTPAGMFQPPATGVPVPTAPPPQEFSPASPAAVTYAPGDGLTVSMLNGTTTARLFAGFSTIAAFNTARTFPAGGPLFLLPSSGGPSGTFDLYARQSFVGSAFSGPEVLGMTPGAFFLAFFQNDNLTSDRYGFLPLTAYADLRNDSWRFAAGLMPDVFNPANPTIVSFLSLFASGNTGSFRGQVRVEHFHKPSDEFQLTTQFAMSDPISDTVIDTRGFQEGNGWPNLEARIAAGIGAARDLCGCRKQRPVEIGLSGVIGQLRSGPVFLPADDPTRAAVTVWGVGADMQAAVTGRFGFAGEVFIGQSLGQYNGMIGQSFNTQTLQPIRGSGGFGEAYYYFCDTVHLHAGYGLDAPVLRDLAQTQIARNQTYYSNLVWELSRTVQMNFEVDYRKTNYVSLPDVEGVSFLTQFLMRF